MLIGRVHITHHAAEQYRKRIDDSLSLDATMQLLHDIAPTAGPLKGKTPAGQEQWRIEEPHPCVLVVKRDRGNASVAVVVTVLEAPIQAATGDDIDDASLLELVIAQQAMASRQSKPRRVRNRTRCR
jgi:hypothetical protein